MQAFRADNIESAYRTAGLFPPERNHVFEACLNICISTTEREQGAEDVTREDVQEGPKTPSKHERLGSYHPSLIIGFHKSISWLKSFKIDFQRI
ncbi:hypothetical protein JCM33374_g3422 [Metschnikowia sp. JCM 33374]|nr:hypothetical protein JCM33374_g3422 [Metschnikowia sp. JCM 33374]